MGDARHPRRIVAAAFSMIVLLLIVYRVHRPVPGMTLILAMLMGVTVVLWILREAAYPEQMEHHRAEWQALDGYATVITALVTGLMTFILTYLIAYLLMLAVYARRQTDIFAQFLFELLQRIRLFELFHVVPLTGIFIIIVTLLVAGVLVLYPVIPFTNQRLAVTTAFLMSWIYTLSATYLIIPLIHPLTVESLIIDTVLVIIWANLFHHLYRDLSG